jgi:hypothetical protein
MQIGVESTEFSKNVSRDLRPPMLRPAPNQSPRKMNVPARIKANSIIFSVFSMTVSILSRSSRIVLSSPVGQDSDIEMWQQEFLVIEVREPATVAMLIPAGRVNTADLNLPVDHRYAGYLTTEFASRPSTTVAGAATAQGRRPCL